MELLPCCYFPTTVYVVDDSDVYLRFAKAHLPDGLSYYLYNDVDAALSALQNRCQPKLILDTLLQTNHDGITHPGDRVVNCSLSQLYRLMHNPQRHLMVSVVFADHAMPQKTGIEFCGAIPGNFIQKVIVTGAADEKIAVHAFNKGMIDGFLRKDGKETAEGLCRNITLMQKRYFQAVSKVVYDVVGISQHSAIMDPVFQQLFYAYCDKIQPVEYYLLDKNGSYVFLDGKGDVHWLFVKDDSNFAYYCDVARGNGAPEMLSQRLLHREVIPFLLSDEHYQLPIHEWEPLLHPAKILEGQQRYYYAYVKGTSVYKLK